MKYVLVAVIVGVFLFELVSLIVSLVRKRKQAKSNIKEEQQQNDTGDQNH